MSEVSRLRPERDFTTKLNIPKDELSDSPDIKAQIPKYATLKESQRQPKAKSEIARIREELESLERSFRDLMAVHVDPRRSLAIQLAIAKRKALDLERRTLSAAKTEEVPQIKYPIPADVPLVDTPPKVGKSFKEYFNSSRYPLSLVAVGEFNKETGRIHLVWQQIRGQGHANLATFDDAQCPGRFGIQFRLTQMPDPKTGKPGEVVFLPFRPGGDSVPEEHLKATLEAVFKDIDTSGFRIRTFETKVPSKKPPKYFEARPESYWQVSYRIIYSWDFFANFDFGHETRYKTERKTRSRKDLYQKASLDCAEIINEFLPSSSV